MGHKLLLIRMSDFEKISPQRITKWVTCHIIPCETAISLFVALCLQYIGEFFQISVIYEEVHHNTL